jgi:RHS repeat-associated protein
VTPGTIDIQRAAVIRGAVYARDESPLPDVAITILDHPEYGSTRTQNDGHFDMAVNGGGVLTVQYAAPDYLPVDRQVSVPQQGYAAVPDVVMIQHDTAVSIEFDDTTQVARGTRVTDADGTRQATLLFPPGTSAQMMVDGVAVPLSSITVRATEYTLGENGPQAMPAALPAASGYTYAVELSIQEAEEAGATQVDFNQPIAFYVENFLNFPVGGIVPAGFYDRAKGYWVPSDNGQVIKIVDKTIDGLAVLDDDAVGLGIGDEERLRLGQLYAVGQTLWRVPITHFSAWDFNWPYGPAAGAVPPALQELLDDLLDDPECISGSLIECESQVLGETADVVGTPLRLHYRSGRTQGRRAARTMIIPLIGSSVPSNLQRIDLEISVAGQFETHSFTPPNLPDTFTFTWNGLDAYGRTVQGGQPATVRIGYVYPAVYMQPAALAQAFAAFSGVEMIGMRARREVTLWQELHRRLGTWDARAQALGGWTLAVHHVYDPVGRALYLGDGMRRKAPDVKAIINARAGNGYFGGSNGDGGPATSAHLLNPYGVAASPDGSLYISEGERIRRVAPDGTISTFAGSSSGGFLGGGVGGYGGDGGPATAALLLWPSGIALGCDGSLYIADSGNNRIRRVADGTITTVAGSGIEGFGGDGGPATAAYLNTPVGVAAAADCSLYIADLGNDRVRRVGPDGIITTVAGTDVPGSGGDGRPAAETYLDGVFDVAAGPDGSIYIAEDTRVRRVGPDGIIAAAAGNGTSCTDSTPTCGDGGSATDAPLGGIDNITVGPDGSLYVTSFQTRRVHRVSPGGVITTVAGRRPSGLSVDTDGGSATAKSLLGPTGVAVASDGAVFVADQNACRVYRISPLLPEFSGNTIKIASESGEHIYEFDALGRHLRTVNALTGGLLYQFGYDGGRLTRVTDGDGNTTTIERTANGDPLAIVGPYGQRTTLTVDPNGYFASIADTAGNTYGFTYGDDGPGLMATMTTPRGYTYHFRYDESGRLHRDEDPAGGSKQLDRTDATQNAYSVATTTAEGRVTTHAVQNLPAGDQTRVTTAPSLLQTTTQIDTNGTRTTTAADGTITTLTQGPDPRFGMQAPVPLRQTVTTPGGVVSTTMGHRVVTLSDQTNPLSLTTFTDTLTLNGQPYTTMYDPPTRTFTTMTPEGREAVTTIDAHSRPLRSQIAALYPVRREYDLRGRLTTIKHGPADPDTSDTRVTTVAYVESTDITPTGYPAVALGRLKTITDAQGRVTTFVYDDGGRLEAETLPGGREIDFTYDADGNVASITPPGKSAHGLTYTPVDLQETYTPPQLSPLTDPTTTYVYNHDRQIESITRPDGQVVNFGYESDTGRLQTITFPSVVAQGNEVRTYEYYPAGGSSPGHLETILAPDANLTFMYDGPLLTSEAWSGTVSGSVTRGYGTGFRLGSLQVNGLTPILFDYDHDGLLKQAENLTLVPRPDDGLLNTTTLSVSGGTVSDSRSYNLFGELESYSASHTVAGTLYGATYTHDTLGRITHISDTVASSDRYFKYDDAGRLWRVCADNACTTIQAEYLYDGNGNRIGGSNARCTSIGSVVIDGQDRLSSFSCDQATTGYSYTDNGELARKIDSSGTTTYAYDALGNLRTVVLPASDGRTMTYLVDGRNRRVGKKIDGTLVQQWLYKDQLSPVAELDGAGNVVAQFVYGSKANVPDYMITSSGTFRILSDHLGSPRLVVDVASGVVRQRVDYDEFGNPFEQEYDATGSPVSPSSVRRFQPFGFAGGLYDADTKLVRFGARDYDPETGRWRAKDPIGFRGGDTNQYGYVVDNPVNQTDRSGLWTVGIGVAGTAGAGGGASGAGLLVFDGHGNIGFLSSLGVGGLAGVGGALGGQFQWTDADNIHQLTEWSLQVGGSFEIPPALFGINNLGAELVFGNGYEGFNLNVGWSVPLDATSFLELHGIPEFAGVVGGNPLDLFNDLLRSLGHVPDTCPK